MYRIIATGLVLAAFATAQDAQKCSALTTAQALPNPTTALTSAKLNAATGAQGNRAALPEHCEILGQMNDRTGVNGQRYAIKFHLRLPTNWNGRFFFEGGGGSNGNLGAATGSLQGQQRGSALGLGYAVVSQDCRGTGGSEPETWDYYVYEREDSFDLVEWVTQQSWFDGFIGGCGGSYAATTQWCASHHSTGG